MLDNQIESFLTKMFEDNKTFIVVNGIKNATDIKYVLISDAISENIKLFTEVVKERI